MKRAGRGLAFGNAPGCRRCTNKDPARVTANYRASYPREKKILATTRRSLNASQSKLQSRYLIRLLMETHCPRRFRGQLVAFNSLATSSCKGWKLGQTSWRIYSPYLDAVEDEVFGTRNFCNSGQSENLKVIENLDNQQFVLWNLDWKIRDW